MIFFRKISFILLFFLGTFFSGNVLATEEELDLYLFSSETCPHCKDEKVFLEKMEEKYEKLVVHELEVTKSEKNRKVFIETLNKLDIKGSGVPLTVIGDEHIVGFGSEDTTGALIEKAIRNNLSLSTETSESNNLNKIQIPFLGEMNPKGFSLPILTVVMGTLDGFNPCAMWVLFFLISLLLGMKDRKRMWIFGITFIVSSAAVYFLFMAAWLNFFIFIGFVFWVRIIIAGVALFTGFYYLRDYCINKEGACKVDGGGKKKKVFDKLKEIINEKTFWWALIGIIFLSFAVNMVELICSAGLPAVFTQILALSDLSVWQYYAYLILYIFFFMLDDIVIFVLAMITLKTVGVSGKYSRFSRLIGGILMVIIGLLLAFRPEWLMFG
jgi:glutaredoxin